MTENTSEPLVLRVADLRQNAATTFDLRPDTATLTSLAADLGVVALRKLRFEGKVVAIGKRDWGLKAFLGFTVTQSCVVSLEPVTTRVEVPVGRQFIADYLAPDDEEFEVTEDENTEALGSELNISEVMAESLALALPLYPRKDGVSLDQVNFTEPGKTAMTDEDTRPFAGLESLRDKLAQKDEK